VPPLEASRPTSPRLKAYVALGVLAGLVYVAFDALSESRLATGTLTGALAHAHALIDRTFPVVVGGLLGVSAHYLRLRTELALARDAASRADALRERLAKVERDQAVWVLAATVLHELMNPLHALGLLLDELTLTHDPAQAKDLTLRARAQVDRAHAQLELLRSMRGSGEPDLARVSLDSVLRALAADVRSLSAHTDDGEIAVTLEGESDVFVRADATYLRTILVNLVDNSLHSLRGRRDGAITLTLATERGRAIVDVHDDGPALEATVHGALFEPLRSTKPDGLGLGLPIARALARAMHGDLALGDARAKSFRLELPLADSPPTGAPS
jgi:signal transduction histidine kinase